MPTAGEWMDVAEEAFKATMVLYKEQLWRSTATRAYYSAHAAAHALGMHGGATLPTGRNNWAHAQVPAVLLTTLQSSGEARHIAEHLKMALETCWNHRTTADYRPSQQVLQRDAKECLDIALRMIGKARRVVR